MLPGRRVAGAYPLPRPSHLRECATSQYIAGLLSVGNGIRSIILLYISSLGCSGHFCSRQVAQSQQGCLAVPLGTLACLDVIHREAVQRVYTVEGVCVAY